MISFEEFSTKLTGFKPYSYQLRIAQLISEGKNIILTVPTGAGKTWASIIPFLYARYSGDINFPQKMIYSLPLRTLANSIYSDVKDVLQKEIDLDGITSINTGEYKNDEHFENDIIFSTIDQTLSNFLCFPLSLSKRQANINAGSLIGSYLVFDEFHLLDPKLSMSTTLGTLIYLGTLCRFCIMTATLSDKYINELKTAVNAEIVSIEDFPEDIVKINSLKIPEGENVKKTVTVINSPINAESILKHHTNKTIVICNRVEKAQHIYNDILSIGLPGLSEKNIICLHSRFFDGDRKKKENDLKRLFSKGNTESAILISTQVIEAGMDISCDKMHLEISPINSFLQRAGRCARWEDQSGEIYVYDILELEDREKLKIEVTTNEEQRQKNAINNKYLPYDKQLCETTFEKLEETPYIDQIISQQMVDEILTEQELKNYRHIAEDNFNRKKIQQSWVNCEKNMYSQTIRDIQSIEIALIDSKNERQKTFSPYRYETINLYKWSFIKWAKEILKVNEDVIFIAESNTESQLIDRDTLDIEGFKLKPINDPYFLKSYFDIIFVDKSIFRYTSGAGLQLGEGESCSPLKPYNKKDKQVIEYKKDTFWQHNQALIGCYEDIFKPKLQFTFCQLDKFWDKTIDWDKLIKTMICLHDYGKLNTSWQKPMKKLQELKANGNYCAEEVLAHCDFNSLEDKEIEKRSGAKNKPSHAGAGAIAFIENSKELIESEVFDELTFSASTAILKHHGTETESLSDFEIGDKDYVQIERLLNDIGVNAKLIRRARGGKLTTHLPTNKEEWITYFFLVRILRLCDQKATIDFNKFLKK